MGKACKDDLFQFLGLLSNSLGNLWMTMAVQGDPPGRNHIKEFAPVFGIQDCTPPRPNGNRVGCCLRLGERMPDVALVVAGVFEIAQENSLSKFLAAISIPAESSGEMGSNSSRIFILP